MVQLEGDEAFNTWVRRLAKQHQKDSQQVEFVKIKKLRPLHSRIEQLELEPVA